jgi:hypothetical protein
MMGDVQEVKAGMRLSEQSGLVEYGVIVDGVFHPTASERTGDYQERQAAGEQALEEEKSSSGKKS